LNSVTEKLDFLRSVFGDIKVARDGVNVAVMCPSCENKRKEKFSINIETWQCHCWICGVKSNNLFFILRDKVSNSLSVKFKEKFDTNNSIKLSKNIENVDSEIPKIPDNFILLSEAYLGNTRDPDIRACISYLFKRGLTVSDLWYFKIGTSIDGNYRRKVIFPSFSTEGEINYFVSRTIDDDQKIKYKNSKNKKTEIIFNEINIDWNREVTIVEGPFDLVKANKNSTCILGSKLSKESRLFKKLVKNKTPVLLALDSDMKLESHMIATSLDSFGCRVKILNNSTTHDVGDMKKQEFMILRNASTEWKRGDLLKFRIESIKTGSILS